MWGEGCLLLFTVYKVYRFALCETNYLCLKKQKLAYVKYVCGEAVPAFRSVGGGGLASQVLGIITL